MNGDRGGGEAGDLAPPEHPYHPISCDVHDQLLALATLRREVELVVLRSSGSGDAVRGVIEDVYTRSGAEYLRMRDGTTLRLDQIRAIDGASTDPVGG